MKFLLIFFLFPLKLVAQDITGVWTGTLYNDTTKQYLKYELAISQDNRKLNGYSYTIFVINNVENIGVKSIKIKKSGDDYLIEDDKLIDNNYTEPPAKGVKIYSDLELKQDDSMMTLSGPWKTNRTKVYESITGRIFLQKKKKIEGTLIIAKLENLGLARSLSFMTYNDYSNRVAINNEATIQRPKEKTEPGTTAGNTLAGNNTARNPGNKTEIQAASNNITPVQKTAKDQRKLLADNQQIVDNSTSAEKGNTMISNSDQEEQPPNSKKERAIQATSPAVSSMKDKSDTDKNKTAQEKKLVAKGTAANKPVDTVAFKNDIATTVADIQNNVDKTDQQILKQTPSTPASNQPKNEPPRASSTTTNSPNQAIGNSNTQEEPGKNIAKNNQAVKEVIPTAPKAAAEISTRKIETIKSVDIKNDSLLLTLYDNGEIDGDTVSVLMNGKVIMPMQGLTAKGISKTVYLTPEMGDSIELIMYAENLGSIPPNTGLLVVHDGESIYEVRFSGDLKKNSAIILRRNKKN